MTSIDPAPPRFWLSSGELTDWARPRACHLVRRKAHFANELYVVSTDPPSPSGVEVSLAPRYADDRLQPTLGRPVVVNIHAEDLELVGVGEIYATEGEATARYEIVMAYFARDTHGPAGAGTRKRVTRWEPIHGFASPGEYNRFLSWIADRIADGRAEETTVQAHLGGVTSQRERWFRHSASGEVWRLVEPEAPSLGLFLPVSPHDPSK